jgi:hypothetical protein
MHRLLVIAGSREQYERQVLGQHYRRQPTNPAVIQTLLPVVIGEPITITLPTPHPRLRGCASRFSQMLGVVLPDHFTTELLADHTTERSHVGIWAIGHGQEQVFPPLPVNLGQMGRSGLAA